MSERPEPAGDPGQSPEWPPQTPANGGPQPPVPAFPASGIPAQGGPLMPAPNEPDWEALADSHEREQKRRRLLRVGSVVGALIVVCGAAAGLVLTHKSPSPNSPLADGSNNPSDKSTGASSHVPIAGPQTVGTLPASKGPEALNLGPDAKAGTVAGFAGQALKLPSGQSSFAQTTKPLVDTKNSFTVSARVLTDVPTGNRAAVSQGDSSFYAFTLGRTTNPAGHNVWDFKVQAAGGGSRTAYSNGDVAVGQWTVLTGVYDSSLKQIKFYVNGAAQASVDVPAIQDGGGAIQVGRAVSNYQWTDLWHGAVAEIQIWDKALPESDVVKVAAGPSTPPEVPPVAAWLTN